MNNIENKMLEDVWIETYSEIFPDFIACYMGYKEDKRIPIKRYIPVKNLLGKIKELYDNSNAILWNKFAGTWFFNKVRTSKFSNVAIFEAYFNNKKIDVDKFTTMWIDSVLILFKNYLQESTLLTG